jgi:hypothetical protein
MWRQAVGRETVAGQSKPNVVHRMPAGAGKRNQPGANDGGEAGNTQCVTGPEEPPPIAFEDQKSGRGCDQVDRRLQALGQCGQRGQRITGRPGNGGRPAL